MNDQELVDGLAALPQLAEIPRSELVWLVEHGDYEVHEAGTVMAARGKPIEKLQILLSGTVAIHVDRGAGPRMVMEWRVGDVTGMLPYSRMTGPPGDNRAQQTCEALALHQDHFPEMIRSCPVFTAHTVHLMLDRARRFNSSDLQDEKMIALGKLAAGLSHELNNPASATVRGAKLLLEGLVDADAASRAIGAAGLSPEALDAIERVRTVCQDEAAGEVLSPLEQADREEEIEQWLVGHGSDVAHAMPLAETAVTIATLDELAESVPPETLDAVLRWIAVGCATRSLAEDVERAATRIHELVAAVKKFTHMDNLAGPVFVDVEAGLRDTARVLAAKAKAKGVAVKIDVEPGLPPVEATGGELNQVWLNLIDNALDAVDESGRIEVAARRELDKVVVLVADDGPGVPADVLPHIFDPFFTTKPPGQGTGLGLEITRRLLRQYHGDISVESRPGRTEFRVSLNAARTGSGESGAAASG